MTDQPGEIEAAVREALANEHLREAVLEFGETRILLTKGRSFRSEGVEGEPAEYPEVATKLKDERDSWLE